SAGTGREGHQRGVVPRLHPLTQTSLVLLPTLEGEGSKEFVMPDAAVNRSAQTTSPTVKKKPLATGDPAAQPNANARPAIQASRLGPRFAIRAVWEPPVDPTIAPTQANGRIL